MNVGLLAGLLAIGCLLVFLAALAVTVLVLAPGKSATANRHEKNRHHAATLVVALCCAATLVAALFIPTLQHPSVWMACAAMLLAVLPARVVLTECGIRRGAARAAKPLIH